MEATRSATPPVSRVTRIVRHNWWLMIMAGFAGLVGGGVLLSTLTRVYESTTTILVEPAGTAGEVNLDTETQLVLSTATATDAARRLGSAETPRQLVARLRVAPIERTSVLRIRFVGGTPRAAQAGSRAFAEAYLANRAEAARADLQAQLAVLNAKLADAGQRLREVNHRIGTLPEDAPELEDLRMTQSTLTSHINALTGRIDVVTTARMVPGAIIGEPDLPGAPVWPDPGRLLGGGVGVGLAIGIAAALLRDRFDLRVRDAADVTRWTSVAVLAELPGTGVRWPDGTGLGRGSSGRAYNRLRNEILASLRPEDRLILAIGASSSVGGTVVAANLAAAFARAGSEVTLVCASGPEPGTMAPLSELLDVADVPGLADVLAHRASLAHALQQAPRAPRLRVITPGGTASAAGLLQTDGVRTVLGTLRYHARYVVVAAPPAAAGADAQSLARFADAVILVVECGTAGRDQVADAAEQVRRVGTRLLGAVVLAPSIRSRAGGLIRPDGRPSRSQIPHGDSALPVGSGLARNQPPASVPDAVLDRIPRTGSTPDEKS